VIQMHVAKEIVHTGGKSCGNSTKRSRNSVNWGQPKTVIKGNWTYRVKGESRISYLAEWATIRVPA